MSLDVNWDVDKYREEHESDEHWELRKAFMVRWKNDYPEERLVCLARVFTNMEFMGCRYPSEVMHEVSRLSQEVAQSYRNSRKNKLQRTFVSASTAAEDRAKGVKRQGGNVVDAPPTKSSKIQFVKSGTEVHTEPSLLESNAEENNEPKLKRPNQIDKTETKQHMKWNVTEYLKEMNRIKCLDVKCFKESMFQTEFGQMVLLIRPWGSKIWNIQTSCSVCKVSLKTTLENGCFSLYLNDKLVAQATGETKAEAKNIVEKMAWNRLRDGVVSVVFKEQYIAQGDTRISVSDVSKGARDIFGTPVDNSVATKMMKLMGWKGGGLGADAQGIAEPIKPNLQMINRAGLGSSSTDIRALRRAAAELMRRYVASDALDVDLVFSSDFSKDERAALHQCAQRAGLGSRSYGDKDRFLVVRKKLDPFCLARAVIEKGGITPKYQVFIPIGLQSNGR